MRDIYIKLASQYCPIWYFCKDEPYMPVNVDKFWSICDLRDKQTGKILINKITNPVDIMNTYTKKDQSGLLIHIPSDTHRSVPLGNQVICRTRGSWNLRDNPKELFIDLVYILVFTWNGTLASHPFDQENSVVRLHSLDKGKTWSLRRVYGSNHGNGLWYEPRHIQYYTDRIAGETIKRPIMYSAFESHAMYNRPGLHKRIFRFGSEDTERGRRWDPTQIILMLDNDIKLLDKDSAKPVLKQPYLKHYFYEGYIGQAKKCQRWPGWSGYVDLDSNNLDGYYKFEGGINNLFNGRHQQVPPSARYTINIVCWCIWFGMVAYFVWDEIQREKLHAKYTKLDKRRLAKRIAGKLAIGFATLILGFLVGVDFFFLDPPEKRSEKDYTEKDYTEKGDI